MKKANVTQSGMYYPNRIIIKSIQDLGEYFEQEREPNHKLKLQNFLENDSSNLPIDYKNFKIESYAEYMQEKTGRGAIHYIADIESKTRVALIKWVSKGYSVMINSVGGWCLLNNDAVVEYINDEPLSKYDIKLMKFKNGSHWYAKIRNIDVVIDGEQKWNARWVAQEKAEQFLKTLQLELSTC